MSACAAYGCRRRPQNKISGITFHRFPSNEGRRLKWILNVRRKNWKPSKCSQLCSDHFTEDMFDRTSLCCVRLRENAVPTIFSAFPSYLQQKENVRKAPLHRKQTQGQDDVGVNLSTADEGSPYTGQSSNSPMKENYKRKLDETEKLNIQYRKKIKLLQQSIRRHIKTIDKYESLLNDIKRINSVCE